MEILFRNTTAYNLSEYKKFAKFHAEKNNLKYHLYTIFMMFLIIFCMVLQFRYGKVLLGTCFILVLLSFLGYRIIHPLLITKKRLLAKKFSKK